LASQSVTAVRIVRFVRLGHFGQAAWFGRWRVAILACLGFCVLFVGLSTYMHAFAWSTGTDSSSPDFARYWYSLLIIELLCIGAGTVAWWSWLVRSARALAIDVTHAEEVGRIAVLWGLVGATCVVLYFMMSFFVNADGAWHQTTVRDTAFTPPHIVMFYGVFPLGITMSVGTALYGITRLTKTYPISGGFPWSFFLLISASVTEMMQVALNEWGHSLWITEEIFSAPFHWPFVIYGWLAMAIFAIWVETIIRLLSIEKEILQDPTLKGDAG
jgi:methane/ammonia monooxygenase subunit C